MIYVASLADYNAGTLFGRWIDASQSADCIRSDITALLAESNEPVAEEWAIHDYEGFEDLRLSEFEDLDAVSSIAQSIVEHGPLFASLVGHFGGTEHIEEARRYMDEAYQGSFDDLAGYAEELISDCWAEVVRRLPDFIRYHIDYAGIAEDMEMNGEIFTIPADGMLHVFCGCL